MPSPIAEVHRTAVNIIHGHSTLRRLLEDVIAHAEVLDTQPDNPAPLVDELRRFSSSWASEFRAHMDYEEAQLFPSLEELSPVELSALLDEHRVLAGHYQRVAALLDVDSIGGVDTAALLEELRALALAFDAHDQHERRVFGVLDT